MNNWKYVICKWALPVCLLLPPAWGCSPRAPQQPAPAPAAEPAAPADAAPVATPAQPPTPPLTFSDDIMESTPLTNDADIVSGLAYGRDLLRNCNLDVRYFQLAIDQLMLLLFSLKDTPTSPHYQEAWTLLQIAQSMRETVYEKTVFSMEQNIGTMNWEEALRDAAYIYRLYPENTPENQNVQRRFTDIQRMMNQ